MLCQGRSCFSRNASSPPTQLKHSLLTPCTCCWAGVFWDILQKVQNRPAPHLTTHELGHGTHIELATASNDPAKRRGARCIALELTASSSSPSSIHGFATHGMDEDASKRSVDAKSLSRWGALVTTAELMETNWHLQVV